MAPLIFLGDFNAILGAHEKRGTRLPAYIACNEFLPWTNANVLLHLDTIGVHYTWLNGRRHLDTVVERLDRAVCNQGCNDFWGITTFSAQVRIHSNHTPLVLTMEIAVTLKHTSFNFFKACTTRDDCRRLVLDTWNLDVVGSGMHRLQQKLLRVKKAFKVGNKTTFGDVHKQVELAMAELLRIQQLIDAHGLDDDRQAQELLAQLALTKALNCQDQLWREEERHQRFIHGNRNFVYFHRVATIKSSSKPISMLQNGDMQLTAPTQIEDHVLAYFLNIFGVENNCMHNDLVETVIPLMVTDNDNLLLTAAPNNDEIKRAVFHLNGDGALGLDGFGGHFIQYFWDIVAHDVVCSVQDFFYSGVIIPNLNANIIVLLPKVPGACSMSDFRPIALDNFSV